MTIIWGVTKFWNYCTFWDFFHCWSCVVQKSTLWYKYDNYGTSGNTGEPCLLGSSIASSSHRFSPTQKILITELLKGLTPQFITKYLSLSNVFLQYISNPFNVFIKHFTEFSLHRLSCLRTFDPVTAHFWTWYRLWKVILAEFLPAFTLKITL